MITINRRGTRPLHISLPDFDKGHRCPGWSGEGWRHNKVDWCDARLPEGVDRWSVVVRTGARPPRGVDRAYELPGFYSWRVRRTNCCNTVVLPQFLMYFALSSWVSRYGAPGPAPRRLWQAVEELRFRFRRLR